MNKDKWRIDPVESCIENFLIKNNIKHFASCVESANLDFYLPDFDIYIECKAFYTPRINKQIKDKRNVLVVQGLDTAKFIETLIKK